MLRCIVLFSLLVSVAFAKPSDKAVDSLARNLVERWGANRLNYSVALELAEKQMEWILENQNVTRTLHLREPTPMVDCSPLPSKARATKITELGPQDIRVVAAIGDSISTGCNSLSSSWLNLKDYYGISWSIGGDDGVVTMPNVLNDYTDIIGTSKGVGTGNTGFNFAENGAVVQDTPAQAAKLVSTLKTHSGLDYNNDWKVVTVLIGGNNLCDVCLADKEKDNNAAVYEKHLDETLATLSQLPRTFVNLVSHLDYTQLAKYKGPFCGLVLGWVCDCLTSSDQNKLARARTEIAAFNAVNAKLAGKYRRDDFAIVLHTMMEKSIVPDDSYISDADCFHPSGAGQHLFGTALWNSMIIPASVKKTYVAHVDDAPNCAKSGTLLYVD